jgi:putative flippase GtrA
MRRLSYLASAQFATYIAVGIIVGLITVGLRALLAALLPSDTTVFYSVSVVAAYSVGVCMSFALQRRITFSRTDVHQVGRTFRLFVGVAVVGALATWALALVFRYVLLFDEVFGSLGATAAFVMAALSASVLTYTLNSRVVFRSHVVGRHGLTGTSSDNGA